MREHAEGPRKTTGSTGRVRKAREGLSRPVLIGRAACPLRPPPIRESGRAGGEDMNHLHATRPPARPRGTPSAVPSFHILRFRLPIFRPVALAGRSHPFPSRTRTLRAPAAMVLRPGAWESSAPPVFFSRPPASRRGWGPFLWLRAGRGPCVSMPRAQCGTSHVERLQAYYPSRTFFQSVFSAVQLFFCVSPPSILSVVFSLVVLTSGCVPPAMHFMLRGIIFISSSINYYDLL